MKRPITTLFMLESVDGKISTGSSDELDFDKDLFSINGVKEGLWQYYEIEQTTDLWSFCTGRTQAKIGMNNPKISKEYNGVSYVILDNTHLEVQGVKNLCEISKDLVIVTQNKNHPAFSVKENNLHIIFQDRLDLRAALEELKSKFGCDRLTVQSGGTLNTLFVRDNLIDYVYIVVAPVLVGGKDTATLMDGKSLEKEDELFNVKAMRLLSCEALDASYIRLRYKVTHKGEGTDNE